jgi:hypothetical protein
MKAFGSMMVVIMFTAVLAAGCAGTQTPPASDTPVPTVVIPTTVLATQQQPTFTLGEKYLEKKYSFTSEKDQFNEQFRVTNEPWGIEFTVNPMNEDPQYTWFEMKVTQMDIGQSETFGYGRTYGYEKHQLIPMYNGGPYAFEMRGNRVSVTVNIAKRNPQ